MDKNNKAKSNLLMLGLLLLSLAGDTKAMKECKRQKLIAKCPPSGLSTTMQPASTPTTQPATTTTQSAATTTESATTTTQSATTTIPPPTTTATTTQPPTTTEPLSTTTEPPPTTTEPPPTTTEPPPTTTEPPPTTTEPPPTTTEPPPTTTEPPPTTTEPPPTTREPPPTTTTPLPTTTPSTGCENVWYLAFEHDATGNALSGSKTDLINKVKAGADVRVAYENVDGLTYVTSIQNVMHVGDNFCGQALHHISKNGYDKFQDDAYWWFVTCCTSGHWQMTRFYVGVHQLKSRNYIRQGLKWFVREAATQHLLSLQNNGSVSAGNQTNVVDAITKGYDVRIKLFDLYVYPVDALEYNSAGSQAAATSLWQIGQISVVRDGIQIKDFQNNVFWWFTLLPTDGGMQVSKWRVGDHIKLGSGTNNPTSSWYGDPCWEQVYEHNAAGFPISGSGITLVNKIKAGHRVKVLFRNMLLEADEVRIRKGQICASLLNDLSKSSMTTFEASLSWRWRQVCTGPTPSARLETLEYEVGANTETNRTIESEALTWFVDKRAWTKVATILGNGTVSEGSKAALIEAVKRGSEVRYYIKPDPNNRDFSILHSADNVQINGTELGATHIRAISVNETGTHQVTFLNDPFWCFTLASTTGLVDMSRWTVGEHVDRGHDNTNSEIDWFVNESV